MAVGVLKTTQTPVGSVLQINPDNVGPLDVIVANAAELIPPVSDVADGLAPVITGGQLVLTSNNLGTAAIWLPPRVVSVFARFGSVVSQAGDYVASQVSNDSTVTGTDVAAALNTLKAALATVVSSVFGRSGAVVAASGDYNQAQISAYPAATSNPTFNQNPVTTAAATGAAMTVSAQDATGTGATVGGSLTVQAGSGATAGAFAIFRRAFGGFNGLFFSAAGTTDVLQFGNPPGSGAPNASCAAGNGTIRGNSSFTLRIRNAANNNEGTMLSMLPSDVAQFGSTSVPSVVESNATVKLSVNGTTLLTAQGSGPELTTICPFFTFVNNGQKPVIRFAAGAGTDPLTVRAQNASPANTSGGRLLLQGGSKTGSGLRRGPSLQFNVDDTDTNALNMLEVSEVTAGERLITLLRPSNLTATQAPAGSGDLCLYVANCATVPISNPVGGGLLYVSAGALTYRGSGGTVTVLGPA